MQIKTIHKWQYSLDTSKKVVKFVWRHVLTIGVFALLFAAFVMYQAINWPMFSVELIIAIALDKFKMSFKSTNNFHNCAKEQMFESSCRNMDSSRFGSSAWATNPAMAGSPANHLYNLGYNTTNYY